MWTRGLPILLGFGALFAANGLTIGWHEAYDVSLGITSPADTTKPVLAWFLSITGWLLVPAVAGGVAGFAVTNTINSRRTSPVEDLRRHSERPTADGEGS